MNITAMEKKLKTILNQILEVDANSLPPKTPDGFLILLYNHLISNQALWSDFKTAPAATTNHHNYVGGLLRHTLSMLEIAHGLYLGGYYKASINYKLLAVGILFHDLGKTEEYSFSSTKKPIRTNAGRLIGHIVFVCMELSTMFNQLQFSMEYASDYPDLLLHMVVSHHGRNDWGSPEVPKTKEAMLLHQLDMIDAKTDGFVKIESAPLNKLKLFTARQYMFDTELYLGDKDGKLQ